MTTVVRMMERVTREEEGHIENEQEQGCR